MVQLFYYENIGKSCKNIWQHQGKTLKVSLHVEESWADTSVQSHLLLKPNWWKPEKIKVIEIRGTKRRSGTAQIVDQCGAGSLWIRGRFKDSSRKRKGLRRGNIKTGGGQRLDLCCDNEAVPKEEETGYFKLNLSSHVSTEDFHLGYCLTGTLERSVQKYSSYQTTHLAVVKRREEDPADRTPSNHALMSKGFNGLMLQGMNAKASAAGWKRLKGASGRRRSCKGLADEILRKICSFL